MSGDYWVTMFLDVSSTAAPCPNTQYEVRNELLNTIALPPIMFQRNEISPFLYQPAVNLSSVFLNDGDLLTSERCPH